jgi:hypothetical protein
MALRTGVRLPSPPRLLVAALNASSALAQQLDIARVTRLDRTKGDDGMLIVRIIPNRAEPAKRLAARGSN